MKKYIYLTTTIINCLLVADVHASGGLRGAMIKKKAGGNMEVSAPAAPAMTERAETVHVAAQAAAPAAPAAAGGAGAAAPAVAARAAAAPAMVLTAHERRLLTMGLKEDHIRIVREKDEATMELTPHEKNLLEVGLTRAHIRTLREEAAAAAPAPTRRVLFADDDAPMGGAGATPPRPALPRPPAPRAAPTPSTPAPAPAPAAAKPPATGLAAMIAARAAAVGTGAPAGTKATFSMVKATSAEIAANRARAEQRKLDLKEVVLLRRDRLAGAASDPREADLMAKWGFTGPDIIVEDKSMTAAAARGI